MSSGQQAVIWSVAMATMVAAAPAAAQRSSGDQILDRVAACRGEADSARRLACFDAAAERLDTARRAKDIVVMDRGEVREKRRALFGLPLPNIRLFGRDDDSEEEVSVINTKAVQVSRYGREQWTVRMEDGSTWQTTEPARFDPRQGDAVTIKRAALGSFRASFAGQSAVRIQRLR